jgi:hypothetical protein
VDPDPVPDPQHCKKPIRRVSSLLPRHGFKNVRFADDGLLYRCRVEKELEEDRYVIEYIDHGNKDLKERSELLILLPAIRDMPVLTRSSQVLLLILVILGMPSMVLHLGERKHQSEVFSVFFYW